MKRNHRISLILLGVLLLSAFGVSDAFAADATTDVFARLGTLGGSFGIGLARLGYLIAGLGLIAFTVAAIFNKISWKTLAYIMMSTFILTMLMGGGIYTFLGASSGYGTEHLSFNSTGDGSSGGNSQKVPTNKNS